jgi:hypothetical protein
MIWNCKLCEFAIGMVNFANLLRGFLIQPIYHHHHEKESTQDDSQERLCVSRGLIIGVSCALTTPDP